jgi:hypothetical protein
MILCFLMNIQLMNVPPAPESTMTVVCNNFPVCLVEKRVTGTRSSLFFPTALVTSTGQGETDLASDPHFKNLFLTFQHPSLLQSPDLQSWTWFLLQALHTLPASFLCSHSSYHLLGVSDIHWHDVLSLGIGSKGLASCNLLSHSESCGRLPWHWGHGCRGIWSHNTVTKFSLRRDSQGT